VRHRQISVSDHDLLGARPGESCDSGLDGTVQTAPGFPKDDRRLFLRPFGHILVVAYDRHREGASSGEYVFGHGPCQFGALGGIQ
jgi:hypothetical protein